MRYHQLGRQALTLVELLFATMILTVAALTVLMLIPEAAQAQRDNRYKLVSAMHVQTMMEAFLNHGWDMQRQRNRLLVGGDDPAFGNLGNPEYSGNDWPHKAKDPENDGNIADALQPLQRLLGTATRYDLEQLLLTQGSGLYPLPPDIARRIDSPNDEIAELIDNGGFVFYIDPDLARRFDIQARRESGAEGGQENPLQRLLVGIVGDPVHEIAVTDPLAEPLYELYPFPPRHLANVPDRILRLNTSIPFELFETRTIPAGTEYRGVILTTNLTIKTYKANETAAESAAEWLPGSLRGNFSKHYFTFFEEGPDWKTWDVKPRNELWETCNWEWGARLENFTASDQDDKTALRPTDASKTPNRWRAGLEHYRRLANQHWSRVVHQVRTIEITTGRDVPKIKRKLKIGERTRTITVTTPVIDPGTGDIAIGDDGLPQFETREEEVTETVSVDVDDAGNVIELVGGTSIDPPGGSRGWPAPARGMPTSTLEGSDILEEDAATALGLYETRVRRSMPSLERRVMYRSAALALWASVACFDASHRVVDITDHQDPSKIYIDNDGDGAPDLDLDGDGAPDRDADDDGNLDAQDRYPKNDYPGYHIGYQGTEMVKRFLPAEANPLITPFDQLCLVRFTSESQYESVRIVDILKGMDSMSLETIESLLDTGGASTWNQIIHPAQVYALSHVAHAAMMVTGYRPPFVDTRNRAEVANHTPMTPDPDDFETIAAGEKWRLPYKPVAASYRIDPQIRPEIIIDADHDLNGHAGTLFPNLMPTAVNIPQRFIALRWRKRTAGADYDLEDLRDNHLLFDQATGEALISDAFLASHPGITSAADFDGNGNADDPPHIRDMLSDGGSIGADGNPDDLNADGNDDLYLALADPRTNLILLHNPYHRLAFPGQSAVDDETLPEPASNDNYKLHIFPAMDPDRDGTFPPAAPANPGDPEIHENPNAYADIDDAGVDIDGDAPDNENHLFKMFSGNWYGGEAPALWADAAASATPANNTLEWRAGTASKPWPLATNGDDFDDDESFNQSIELQPYLQWTMDFDQDGLEEGSNDQGPIPYRPMFGDIINEFPPPYSGTGAIDGSGHRRYGTAYHLWLDEDGGGDSKPKFGLLRVQVDDGESDLADQDLRFAHHAHKNALRMAISYTTQNPYDLTVPRPLNNPVMNMRPLAAQDLFDTAGLAKRPEDLSDTERFDAWYPFTMPATAPLRLGAPSARTEYLGHIGEWSAAYTKSDVDSDGNGVGTAAGRYPSYYNNGAEKDGDFKYSAKRTFVIDPNDLPLLGNRFGPGAPYIIGSPVINPDDEVSPSTGYRILRDIDGTSGPDMVTGKVNRPWRSTTYVNGIGSVPGDAGQDLPGWSFYTWPRMYNRWANRLHGHAPDDTLYAWQTRTKRPDRFHHTNRFKANSRARQVVYWVANWNAYEDAESAPGAPIDQSRLPKVAQNLEATLISAKKSDARNGDGELKFPDEWSLGTDPVPANWPAGFAVEVRIAGYTFQFVSDREGPEPWHSGFKVKARGVSYPPGVTPPDENDLNSDGQRVDAYLLEDLIAAGESGTVTFAHVNASQDNRLPNGHPERNIAWMDPERTATRYKWDERHLNTLAVASGQRILLPHGNRATPLRPTQIEDYQGDREIRASDIDAIAIPHLVPFGADRDGNGELSNGELSRDQRIQADVIARYTFYDPVMWLSPGR